MHSGLYTSTFYKIRDLKKKFYWQIEDREWGQEQLMHLLYEQILMDVFKLKYNENNS